MDDNMNTYGNLNDDSYDYMTNNHVFTYSIDNGKADKPKLSKEEIEKIKAESFKDPDDRYSGIFSEVEENYNKECPPMTDMSISEDHIITFNLGSVDPAESGRKLYRKKTVFFRPNRITPLVGCNGVGKSSMLHVLASTLKVNRYFNIFYDNLNSGAKNKIGGSFFSNDFSMTAQLLCSSEGENIHTITISELGKVVQILEGKIKRDTSYRPYRDTDHVFILLDAIDSGSSIDNIINLKMHMNTLIELAKKNNKNLYIIIAANSFELARNELCWDTFGSKEIEFGTDYEAYRKYVVSIRNKILKQWERMEEKRQQEEEKKKKEEENEPEVLDSSGRRRFRSPWKK